jgi:hypothetical protein
MFGNPFQPTPVIEPRWLAWSNGRVAYLAQVAYEERTLPERTLSANDLGVLVDALEEAGCMNRRILEALRDPGPKFRGFWVLDALLQKE